MDGGTQAGGRRLPTREVLKTQGPKAFRIIEAQLVEKEGLTGTAAMQRRERCTKSQPKISDLSFFNDSKVWARCQISHFVKVQ
jgi:hypothetical protein